MHPLYDFLKPIAEAHSPANQHWDLKNATTINGINNNNNNQGSQDL
jgi:hypothetical protein